MLGGGGNPEAWWELEGERSSHDGTRSAANVERVAQGNGWLGVELATTIEPAGDAWIAPIETVSNSEAGFERVYQGSALLLSWPVRLAPGGALVERRSATRRARQPSIGGSSGARAPRDSGLRIRQPAACAPRADDGGELGRIG